jgi:hypothetical protein
MEWLQLLMSGIWRWPRDSVGWFNWHDGWCLEVIAGILVHRCGVVLAPTIAVASHVSPLTAAIVILLVRLIRVWVHAVRYVE